MREGGSRVEGNGEEWWLRDVLDQLENVSVSSIRSIQNKVEHLRRTWLEHFLCDCLVTLVSEFDLCVDDKTFRLFPPYAILCFLFTQNFKSATCV